MIPLSPGCLRWKPRSVALIVAGLCAALAVRYPLLPFESGDYRVSLSNWYDFIVDHGVFAHWDTASRITIVFTIILAFWRPRYWYVPIVVGLASLCAYFPFLGIGTILPLPWAAAGLLALCAVLGWQLLRNLWPARSGDALGAPHPPDLRRTSARTRPARDTNGSPVRERGGESGSLAWR